MNDVLASSDLVQRLRVLEEGRRTRETPLNQILLVVTGDDAAGEVHAGSIYVMVNGVAKKVYGEKADALWQKIKKRRTQDEHN